MQRVSFYKVVNCSDNDGALSKETLEQNPKRYVKILSRLGETIFSNTYPLLQL